MVKSLLAALLVLASAAGAADGAGVEPVAGSLEIALKGHALVARLSLPAGQVVGFEHAPGTDEERMAVRDALGRLSEARNVLEPAPEALCSVTRQNAGSSLSPPVSTPPARFTGRYAWRCQQPDALLALDVPLLEFINGVPLDILLLTPSGERAWTLKAPDTRIPVLED
ncbi:ZrgA family zinc uptake protein [Alloalcanivorax marinus]|uniref:ZrgA family zinc uptake protein n=1 Tax=Alloalcanivorax marinus TaxID=1177169 RepID=UPI0019341CF0|nr:DUF2796 domain-containing protein [Alloalcanivorax marinus]MBL7250136.1 DUF2796 domain-containing protein [Alloalcanivorax marinus]